MEENEFGAVDEESPPPTDSSHYLPQAMHTMAPASMRMGGLPSMAPPHMMSTQHLLRHQTSKLDSVPRRCTGLCK